METWNKRLARAVADSGKTPNKLAGEVGVSAPTFAAWIGAANIKPAQDITAANLFKVCRLLGVRPAWVLLNQKPRESSEIAELSENEQKGVESIGVNPGFPDLSGCLKVSDAQLEEFLSELKAAWTEGRLTPRRFFLLRELLRESTESLVGDIENQKMATRGAHGRRTSRHRKTGTE